MHLVTIACSVCGLPVVREERYFEPGARVVCGGDCKAVLCAVDRGVSVPLEPRRCSSCREAFMADVSHVGAARQPGGPEMCPACWREGLWEARDADPYLDYVAGLSGVLWALLADAARQFWAPSAPCPRCGLPAGGPYEWSCRYPLTVGICEGLRGPHVHSICRSCGYETVRLKTKKPPHRSLTAGGLGQGMRAMIPTSSPRTARSPLSTTSLR